MLDYCELKTSAENRNCLSSMYELEDLIFCLLKKEGCFFVTDLMLELFELY